MKHEWVKAVINYVGQLRMYSLVDMALLCAVLSHDVVRIVGVLLWWLGFLVYLEGEHRDSGRRLWPLRSMARPGAWGAGSDLSIDS